MRIHRFTLKQVESMPVLHQGHMDNLIYETESVRIWHSRMTKEDGMPYDNQITVENLIDGSWVTVAEYQAK